VSASVVFALHGFLGQGSDWQLVQNESVGLNTKWITPDLFSKWSLPVTDFESYVDSLMSIKELTAASPAKKIFLGYSLGGRLGLHILKKYAQRFDHFVFISTNPGLQSVDEKMARLQNDLVWADKILNSSWNNFLDTWNAQGVFSKNDPEPVRDAREFDTQKLALSMDLWSLGRQQDFRSVIAQYQNKISWLVGEHDTKFSEIASDLAQKKILLGFNKIFSGHRILFSNPSEINKILKNLS